MLGGCLVGIGAGDRGWGDVEMVLGGCLVGAEAGDRC